MRRIDGVEDEVASEQGRPKTDAGIQGGTGGMTADEFEEEEELLALSEFDAVKTGSIILGARGDVEAKRQISAAASSDSDSYNQETHRHEPDLKREETGKLSLKALFLRVERLRVENEILRSNISSLFNTARSEMEKKDAIIAAKDRKIAKLTEALGEKQPSGGMATRLV